MCCVQASASLDGRWSVRVRRASADVGEVRRRFRDWVRARGVDQSIEDDALVVLSELLTNALQHGVPAEDEDGDVDVAAEPAGSGVVVTVANKADSDAVGSPDTWAMPVEPLAASGRGLAIVRHLSDRVELSHDGRRLCIRCRLGTRAA